MWKRTSDSLQSQVRVSCVWLTIALAVIAHLGLSVPARAQGWIHGEGANLNGVALDTVLVGFGDRILWTFGEGQELSDIVSSVDLIIGGNSIQSATPVLRRQLETLRLEHGLRNARFLMIWVTPQWQPDWFPPDEVQRALDNGITLVFLDWYFGDKLLAEDPKELVRENLEAFSAHSRRLGEFIGQFDGDVLVVVEPELNKPAVEAWPKFGSILREHGIAEVRRSAAKMNAATGRQTTLFFGTTLTDNGLRSPNQEDDVYGVKSRGDSYGWTLSRPLLEELRPDLDFIGFQQILSQFHRHHREPDKAIANTFGELGLTDLPIRLTNYSEYLKQQLGIPILIPFIGLPTSTWEDVNNDGIVQASEVSEDGWRNEVGNLLIRIRRLFPTLEEAGVIGVGAMMLFDDPVHDLGGYQYLLENEYALGLVKTDARNARPGETLDLNLEPKGIGLVSFVEILFQSRLKGD